MPRILTLQLKDFEIPVSLHPFSRDTLYGKSSREKRGEEGELYTNALITLDGTHILPYGGIGANYIDPDGNYLEETLLVDSDGKAIPVERSMYNTPVRLSKTVSLQDYYSYNIDRAYIVRSEEMDDLNRLTSICEKLLEQDKMYRLTYAYYDTTTPRDMVLIPKEGDLFAVVGEAVKLILLKPTEILYSDIEEEELEEELAFEVW
jgi:hypothetical protein